MGVNFNKNIENNVGAIKWIFWGKEVGFNKNMGPNKKEFIHSKLVIVLWYFVIEVTLTWL